MSRVRATYRGHIASGVVLEWDAPTQTVSGGEVGTITGYRVHWGTESMVYTHSDSVVGTSFSLAGFAPGTYYMAVTALTNEYESTYSHEIVKVVS